jgi:exonuclease III
MPYLQQFAHNGREYIICGGWNIAYKPIDLENWRGNRKNSGFLPEKRAWLDKIKAASIYKKERFSDHAPLIMDCDYPF